MLTMMYLHVPITKLPVKEKNALKRAQKCRVTLSGGSFLFASLSPLLLPGSTFLLVV